MKGSNPAQLADLAAAIESLSGFVLGQPEALQAARHLAGFVALLLAVDKGDENAGDGSGHRAREAERRPRRVRERRA